MAGDYWEDHYWDDYAMSGLAGAGSGAATGALVGSAIPVVGTAAGAIIGGTIGLATGIYEGIQGVNAQEDAKVRDAEIAAELDALDKQIEGVNTLGDFISATGAGAAEQAQNIKTTATQEAARMGLSSGASAEYSRMKERDVMGAYGQMLSAAVPAAKQADISEKSRLMSEKQFVLSGTAARQALQDQGNRPMEMLQELGEIGANLMVAKSYSDKSAETAKGVSAKGVGATTTGGAVVPGGAPVAPEGAPVAPEGAPPPPAADLPEFGTGDVQNISGADRGETQGAYNYRRTMSEAGTWSYEYQKGIDGDWSPLNEAGISALEGDFGAGRTAETQITDATQISRTGDSAFFAGQPSLGTGEEVIPGGEWTGGSQGLGEGLTPDETWFENLQLLLKPTRRNR